MAYKNVFWKYKKNYCMHAVETMKTTLYPTSLIICTANKVTMTIHDSYLFKMILYSIVIIKELLTVISMIKKLWH